MPLVLLAQTSPAEGLAPSLAASAIVAALIAVAIWLPLFLRRATRRWSFAVLALVVAGQAAVLTIAFPVAQAYASFGSAVLPWLLALVLLLIIPTALMLWRRTRRLGLALAGLSAVSLVALANYWGLVIGSIGYLLLLLALWPRWRLLRGAPRGKETAPVAPSRGVLSVRPWPVDGRWNERGFSLVSTLVGVACVTLAFALAAQVIGGTTLAIHRADHLAVATDLLESARERAVLGAASGDLAGLAAKALPHGTASLSRAAAGQGLVRITAVVTWQEPNGRSGRATLEWLAVERTR